MAFIDEMEKLFRGEAPFVSGPPPKKKVAKKKKKIPKPKEDTVLSRIGERKAAERNLLGKTGKGAKKK